MSHGLVSGPLLFLVCVNDLTNGLKTLRLVLVDDFTSLGMANDEAIERNLNSLPVTSKIESYAELEQVTAVHGRS